MYSNYTSADEYANDLARYVKLKSKTCFGIYGCITRLQSFCISLTNAPAGYLVKNPQRLFNGRMVLLHTSPLPQNTPGMAVTYVSPNHSHIKPQGFFTPTDDPSAENVEYWGDWLGARKNYRANRRVGRFRLALEVSSPKELDCDIVQEPPIPSP